MAVESVAGGLMTRLESTFPVSASATATTAAKQQSYWSANGFVRCVVVMKRDQLMLSEARTDDGGRESSEYSRRSVTPTSLIPLVDGKDGNRIRKIRT